MFSFLSRTASAVLGGDDDAGSFFDLASAEELIQGLRDGRKLAVDFLPFPTPEGDNSRAEATPRTLAHTSVPPSSHIRAPVLGTVPLPEAEQVVLDLKLPTVVEVEVSESLRQEVEAKIVRQDDIVVMSDRPESTPSSKVEDSDLVSVTLPGADALSSHQPPGQKGTEKVGSGLGATGTTVVPPQDMTEAPASGVPESVSPRKQGMAVIKSFKSLKEHVRVEKSDTQMEVISFDDVNHVDMPSEPPAVSDMPAASQPVEPPVQSPIKKTVKQDASPKAATLPLSETKSPGKKKRRKRKHCCYNCRKPGHSIDHCPDFEKSQEEAPLMEQAVPVPPPSGESNTAAPAPSLDSQQEDNTQPAASVFGGSVTSSFTFGTGGPDQASFNNPFVNSAVSTPVSFNFGGNINSSASQPPIQIQEDGVTSTIVPLVSVSPAHSQELEVDLPMVALATPQTPSRPGRRSFINWAKAMVRASVRTADDNLDGQSAPSFSFLGNSEFARQFPEEGVVDGTSTVVLGPSTLIRDGGQHTYSGILGPPYLNNGTVEDAAMDDIAGATAEDYKNKGQTTEEQPQTRPDVVDDGGKESWNLIAPSSLREQQVSSLAVVPGSLTSTTDSAELQNLVAEHTVTEKRGETNDTRGGSTPKTGLLGVMSRQVASFISWTQAVIRAASEESVTVAAYTPMVTEHPTSQNKFSEARRPVTLRFEVSPLTAATDSTYRPTEPGNLGDTGPIRVPVVAQVGQGDPRSPKILPPGTQDVTLHQPIQQQAKTVAKKSSKKTAPQKEQQPKKESQPKKKQQPKTEQQPKKEQPEKAQQQPKSKAKDSTATSATATANQAVKQSKANKAEARRLALATPPLHFKTKIAPHVEAWSYASMAYSSPSGSLANEFGPHHLVMWTDATCPDETYNKRLQALAVTYRHPSSSSSSSSSSVPAPPSEEAPGWRDWAFTASVDGSNQGSAINTLEALAIEAAINIALGEVSKPATPSSPSITKVTVFSDSQHALMALSSLRGGESPIEVYASRLRELGVEEIHLRWVPGHAHVDGNMRADQLASLASRYAPAPEAAGGMVRVPVPLLRACQRTVNMMETWGKGNNQEVLGPFIKLQRGMLKEALRMAGAEEGWEVLGGSYPY